MPIVATNRQPRRGRLAPLALGLLLLGSVLSACAIPGTGKPRVLILVVDGLRPDYVTAELMPRLNGLAESGVRGSAHHAVIPTVTRVNGPSIFTGTYPSSHGLMGNAVYMAEVDPERILDASNAEDLRTIDRATGSELLTAPSLGELLESAGLVYFAASSGSTGSGMLMNHRGAGAGFVHHEFTIPDSLGPVVTELLGPPPGQSGSDSSVGLVARAVDAVLQIGLDRADADVMAAWLTEPDGTAHANGIGAPETLQVLRSVDAEIGHLLDGLAERGVLDDTNIMVTSDHGFSTHIGTQSIGGLLVEAGLKESPESMDVVIASGAIHVQGDDPARIVEIARVLQATDWIGPVLTSAVGDGSGLGRVPGTAAFDAIGWNHPRSGDLFTSPNWTDDVNEHGYAGQVFSGGVAGHGSTSPWDIRATFIAAGPDIKRATVSDVPTGNVDLTPTTLFLMDAPIPGQMHGRVLGEVLRSGPDPESLEVGLDPIDVEVALPDMTYRLTVERSRVGGVTYVDGTRVERIRLSPGATGSVASLGAPLVVFMDSRHPARVYDEQTLAAERTNADVLSDLLADVAIRREAEAIGPGWAKDADLARLRPDLVVIHYSGFREEDGTGPRERLKLLIGHLADTDTRLLVYSRTREGALRDLMDELLSDLVPRHPSLRSRIDVFGLDDHGPRSWLSPETSGALKARIRAILEV